MQLPNRRWKGMECPVQIRKSPKWQGTCQEAASPRSDSEQHPGCLKCAAHTLPFQTTLRPWDWRKTKQSMPCRGKTNLTKGGKLQQIVWLMWMMHKVPPTWQIIMPSKGWPLLRMWKIRTLEVQVPKWTKRTQGQGTQTPQQRRKTEEGQWSWNWWRPLLQWSWCCYSCSADTISQGMTNCQTYEEQCWSWDNWVIWCLDRLNNWSLCDCPDASWDWTK